MKLRCAACGFVNQQADAETAFCPNCGAAYAPDNALTVAMGPSFADAPPYRTPPAQTPYGTPPPPPFAAFGPATPPAPTPKPASRVGAFMVGMIVTLAIIVLAGVGYVAYAAIQHTSTTAISTSSTITPTSQVPTAPPTQTLFTLTPPQGWSEQTAPLVKINGTRTSYISPDQTAAISVIVAPGTLPADTITLASIVKSLKGTQYKRTSTGSASYPSATWGKVSGTYVSQNGVPYQIVALFHRHQQHAFVIAFFAPQSTFAATDSADFEPLMQSFAFA